MLISRRSFLSTALILTLTSCKKSKNTFISNDISDLEKTHLSKILNFTTEEEIIQQLKNPSWICLAGGQFSQGGHTLADQATQIKFDNYNKIIHLDVENKTVRVQAGIRWRQLQEEIDKYNLSIKVMQSYSNFSVGGSVSVNCHGRYIGTGSISDTIRSMRVVLSNGDVVEANRDQNQDIFAAVIGGYGLIGIVTEVELDLIENEKMERKAEYVDLKDYLRYFKENIENNQNVIMHNADLLPPLFNKPLAISYLKTNKDLTISEKLQSHNKNYNKEQNLIWFFSEFNSDNLREKFITSDILNTEKVIYRNYEASLDVYSLEPRTRKMSTYLLQEYFIPTEKIEEFAKKMSSILINNEVNALNISIRHAKKDTTSVLKWAKEDVFCFVLYFKQRKYFHIDELNSSWTQELIDAAISCGGTYYLPYRPHATQEQFNNCYNTSSFLQTKMKYDPNMRLVNNLFLRYFMKNI